MTDTEPIPKLTRMSMAFQPHIVEELRELAADQHCSMAEAIRRAIAMYRWFIKQHKDGYTMAVISPDGTVTPKEFVIML